MCENSYLRTEAQGALALGKLIGAFLSGIIADKYVDLLIYGFNFIKF